MGPVASLEQLEANLAWVRQAGTPGLNWLRGERLNWPPWLLHHRALYGYDNAMAINREELFAPIACVIKADGYEDALGMKTRVRSHRGHYHPVTGDRHRLQKTRSQWLRHGQSAHRRNRLPCALWRA